MSQRSFAGRRVVVTGASAGLGRAIARAFGEARARVAATGLAAAALGAIGWRALRSA